MFSREIAAARKGIRPNGDSAAARTTRSARWHDAINESAPIEGQTQSGPRPNASGSRSTIRASGSEAPVPKNRPASSSRSCDPEPRMTDDQDQDRTERRRGEAGGGPEQDRRDRTASGTRRVASSDLDAAGKAAAAFPSERCRNRTSHSLENWASQLRRPGRGGVVGAGRASSRPSASAWRPSYAAVREKSDRERIPTVCAAFFSSARATAAARESSSRWASRNSNHRER